MDEMIKTFLRENRDELRKVNKAIRELNETIIRHNGRLKTAETDLEKHAQILASLHDWQKKEEGARGIRNAVLGILVTLFISSIGTAIHMWSKINNMELIVAHIIEQRK